jgi:toxin YhaV
VISNGWTLHWHKLFKAGVESLKTAVLRAKKSDPQNYKSHEKYKLLKSVRDLIIDEIPKDPRHCQYHLWNDLPAWKRAKLRSRYRLFFRFFSNNMSIIYAWINDEKTIRKDGDKNDPYSVFRKMVNNGSIASDQQSLESSAEILKEEEEAMSDV